MKTLYAFDLCEAKTAQNVRCTHEATKYIKNPGAMMPMQVCGIHERSGLKLIARDGGLPRNWGKYA